MAYFTDVGEYCLTLGYQRSLTSQQSLISQVGTIFTSISAKTL